MRDRTPVQSLAALVGLVFLLVGILGFIPGITSHYSDLGFAGHDSTAKLLGIFQTSVLHNIIHIAFGVGIHRCAGSNLARMELKVAVEEWLNAMPEFQITSEQIMRTLSDYLFDPYEDRNHLVRDLSGGQKARLQLIKMFANDPNLLILDEPTNHLDLPSIEELEAALDFYKGALVYISHDSYLAKHLGGEELAITKLG